MRSLHVAAHDGSLQSRTSQARSDVLLAAMATAAASVSTYGLVLIGVSGEPDGQALAAELLAHECRFAGPAQRL
ncbi:MAG: hypothetical protein J2P17_20735, partial [Mycobacterium sp.]|nr:hypothetical protein [Mycobacterium sp.]